MLLRWAGSEVLSIRCAGICFMMFCSEDSARDSDLTTSTYFRLLVYRSGVKFPYLRLQSYVQVGQGLQLFQSNALVLA